MCFVFIWEQTATCATYSINWLVFITEMKSVYSAVRTGYLSTEYDLVLPYYISSILSFPSSHTVVAYVFLLTFLSLYPSPVFPSLTWFRRQLFYKMWPIQLPFPLFTLCRTFSFPRHVLTLLSFSHVRSSWSPPSFSSTTLKLSRCLWSTVRSSKVSAPYKLGYKRKTLLAFSFNFHFNLMVKRVVLWLNAVFAMTILDLISAVNLATLL